MTSFSPDLIWVVVGTAALGTWLARLSFIALLGRLQTVPPTVGRVLRLIPAAVLAALVTPSVLYSDGSLELGSARFAAGVIAALVAWRTRHVLLTITTGMAILWLVQAM